MKQKLCKTCGNPIDNKYSSLQKYCSYLCSITDPDIKKKPKTKKVKLPKPKKKINHTVSEKRKKIRDLETRADALYQMAGKMMYPKSIASGQPVEVIHHYIPKSQSNNLRYDFKNACPATNGEHFRHHNCSDPKLHDAFKKDRGQEWIDDLELRRHITVKQTEERLNKVIQELEEMVYSKVPF